MAAARTCRVGAWTSARGKEGMRMGPVSQRPGRMHACMHARMQAPHACMHHEQDPPDPCMRAHAPSRTCPGPTVDLPACVAAALASLRPAAWARVSPLSSSCLGGCLGLRAATAAAVFSTSVLFRPLVSPPPLPEGPGLLGSLCLLVEPRSTPIDRRVAAPNGS
jgi:hypothetical protein